MFEANEGLEKGMKEATENLEESRGLANWQHWRQRRDLWRSSDTHMMIIFEPVFKWEVVRSAIQACPLVSVTGEQVQVHLWTEGLACGIEN